MELHSIFDSSRTKACSVKHVPVSVSGKGNVQSAVIEVTRKPWLTPEWLTVDLSQHMNLFTTNGSTLNYTSHGRRIRQQFTCFLEHTLKTLKRNRPESVGFARIPAGCWCSQQLSELGWACRQGKWQMTFKYCDAGRSIAAVTIAARFLHFYVTVRARVWLAKLTQKVERLATSVTYN